MSPSHPPLPAYPSRLLDLAAAVAHTPLPTTFPRLLALDVDVAQRSQSFKESPTL